MRVFLLAIAMIASCTLARAQVNAAVSTTQTSQGAKPSSQATKQRSIGSENLSRSDSNLNASNHALNHNASSAPAAAAHHPSPLPKSRAVRHFNPNAAVVGGSVNTNKSGNGTLNGTTMKRKF